MGTEYRGEQLQQDQKLRRAVGERAHLLEKNAELKGKLNGKIPRAKGETWLKLRAQIKQNKATLKSLNGEIARLTQSLNAYDANQLKGAPIVNTTSRSLPDRAPPSSPTASIPRSHSAVVATAPPQSTQATEKKSTGWFARQLAAFKSILPKRSSSVDLFPTTAASSTALLGPNVKQQPVTKSIVSPAAVTRNVSLKVGSTSKKAAEPASHGMR